jgi:uncharacterized protein (TIGR02231 family)
MLKPIETTIVAVTVYTDRALITRRGKLPLTGAETALTIANLPTTLEPDSVRVSGRGTIPVKLQGVTIDRQFTTEPVGDQLRTLSQEIDRLEAEKTRLQVQLDTLTLQSEFIQGLRQKTEQSFSRNLATKSIDLEDTSNLLNFIGSKHTEYATNREEILLQKQHLEKQLQALQSQLKQLQRPRSKESFQITVAIVPETPAETPAETPEFQLEVTYVVQNASWKPLYDLRIQKQTLHLTYLAAITQTSGENWSDISLTLSTAKPGLGQIPPKLEAWYIDVPRKRSENLTRGLISMAAPAPAEEFYRGRSGEIDRSIPEEPEAEPEYKADVTVAEISQDGGVVTFQIGGSSNIPSDGNPHKATILNEPIPCQFTYLAMPRLVSFAYLQAKAKNRSDGATFLPGKANIFREQVFVGTTDLENIAPGQEFKINLGIDEALKLDRTLIERQADKKLLGSNRRITYAYRITVTNLSDRPIKLDLQDQIPHSRTDLIKIKLNKTTPSIPIGELGRLNWHLDLAANSKTEVYYQFAIEHPENAQITGLSL